MQMGRLWTLLIVAQVALTVALMPAAMFYTLGRTAAAHRRCRDLRARSSSPPRWRWIDRSEAPSRADDAAFKSRYAAAHRELDERLRAEPQVADVTFSLVDAGQELAMALVVEGQPPPSRAGRLQHR